MDASALATRLGERTAAGIAAALSRMIASGALPSGSRLPTVRALANELGVSPTTVSEAWSALSGVGAIEARGRAGTFVRSRADSAAPRRYRQITGAGADGGFGLDLATGTPDPDLLPDLSRALAAVARGDLTTNYLDDPVLPALDATLRKGWPFVPEALTVVDGALDAIDRLISIVVPFGARVLVENPAFPPVLDRLEQAGAEIIPLEMDEEGVTVTSLREGLTHEPVAVFLQPRAQNPTGVSLTPARALALAQVLAGAEVLSPTHPSQHARLPKQPETLRASGAPLIIEDDHAGAIAFSAPISLGTYLPERTIRILSFSKSYGPDLRLAAVGGAAEPIAELVARRRLGAGWSSRLLQSALNWLMHDRETQSQIAKARKEYARRRMRLVAELGKHGIQVGGSDGINIWIPVANERDALIALAARSVGAAPGSPFTSAPVGPHIRVTAGLVRDNFPTHAAELAAAATSLPQLKR